jgi:glycosyltransferase involved in cell wall biosynthesis
MRELRPALEPVSDIMTDSGAVVSEDEGRRKLGACVAAVIPCLEEEESIAAVVRDVFAQGVAEVIVVDGGSRDRTAPNAAAAGARVVIERQAGYGQALQAGIAAARPDAGILVFLDGDGSDRPEFIPALVTPIADGLAVFVHGSRVRGEREPGSLSPQQIAAGRLAGLLLRLLYGVRVTDISPFRAIRRDELAGIGMREATYGWNLEMLMRLAAAGLPMLEIPVGQRCRAGGISKVSGNLAGGLKAVTTLIATFARLAVILRNQHRAERLRY